MGFSGFFLALRERRPEAPNAIDLARALGIEIPQVAILSATGS